MSAATETTRVGPGDHAVHLYRDDAELAGIVGEQLTDALVEGAVGVLIASEPHARALARELEARGLDLATEREAGRVILLDASETLARFTADGRIDRDAFGQSVGEVLRRAAEGARPVWAYGDMVDVMWQAGQIGQAIELEVLWSELIDELGFSLLCAYQSEAVAAAEHHEALGEVCRLHSSVSRAPSAPEPRHELTRDFEPEPEAPRAARRFVEEALRQWGHDEELLEDARLLLSELATNSVIHARSRFSVAIRPRDSRVRLEVHDRSPAELTQRAATSDALSGRGLHIVGALAKDWGVLTTATGKTVWAEL